MNPSPHIEIAKLEDQFHKLMKAKHEDRKAFETYDRLREELNTALKNLNATQQAVEDARFKFLEIEKEVLNKITR